MSNSGYDQWAEIYDSVYSYVREDIPFYVEEARRAGSPILELGCGTGRVALPIAEAGLEIVGPGLIAGHAGRGTSQDAAGRATWWLVDPG